MRVFLLAGLLAVLLFALTHFFVSQLETQRRAVLDIDVERLKRDFSKLQGESCGGLLEKLGGFEKDLWKVLRRLEAYRKAAKDFFGEDFYKRVELELLTLQLSYVDFLDEVEERCGVKKLLVFHFFGNCDVNPRCGYEGHVFEHILDYYSRSEKVSEVVVLGFDCDLGVPRVSEMLSRYNISTFPCIVVEGEVYCGLRPKGEVLGILCSHANLAVCRA